MSFKRSTITKDIKMDKIKDGHTDVASARRQCVNALWKMQEIINALPNDDEASLQHGGLIS